MLELADQLSLTREQHAAIARFFAVHKAEARYFGARLVQAERALHGMLRRGAVAEDALAEAVRNAAALAGEYRLSYLDAHRRTRNVLSAEQIARYGELRGYGSDPAAYDPHAH